MHAPTLISLLSLSLLSVVSAAPTIIVLETNNNAAAAAAEAAGGMAAAAASELAPQAGNGTTAAGGVCDSATMALAQGISSNIADQQNELTTVTAMGNILAQNPLDTTLYSATQSSLLGFVTKGISIRQNNQKIAPPNNPALPGLAMVAMAQMTELNLTMGLAMGSSGMVDVKAANQTVEMLKGDFMGGIVQNMKNLAAAMGNCTAATGTTGTGTGTGAGAGASTPSPSSTVKPAKIVAA